MSYSHRINAKELRRWRILRGYSLQTLADRASLSRNTVWSLEKGIRGGLISTIAALADALSAPISALLDEDDEEDAA